MPACKVCSHPERPEIDEALAAGQAHRAIARRFGVTRDSIDRHAANHLTPALVRLRERREERGAARVVDRVSRLANRLEAMLDGLEEQGAAQGPMLQTIRELRPSLELLAKLTGELRPETAVQVVNVTTSPSWVRIRTALVDALAPYPAAAAAVADVLVQSDRLEAAS